MFIFSVIVNRIFFSGPYFIFFTGRRMLRFSKKWKNLDKKKLVKSQNLSLGLFLISSAQSWIVAFCCQLLSFEFDKSLISIIFLHFRKTNLTTWICLWLTRIYKNLTTPILGTPFIAKSILPSVAYCLSVHWKCNWKPPTSLEPMLLP